MKILLPLLIFITACSNQPGSRFATPLPVNAAMTSKLKKDVQENFEATSWYRHIIKISVRDNNIEVLTDLTTADESARRICGAISGLYYAYDNSTQNEDLKLFGQNGLLLERDGISSQCR